MEKIVYSSHLLLRLKLREIPYDLPKKIFKEANEYFFDTQTQKKVAIKQVKFKNKFKEMAVIYEEINDQIILITIHPLKNYQTSRSAPCNCFAIKQKISRIKLGRWQKL